MQKDVIYIDVDDDITAIIDKVKSSSHKIIALVPPKRTGVLQSAVNLRLINRAATQGDKRLVVITNDAALSGLAAAASIPVAKNLQSKPELAEVAALSVDDEDDIIDGAELPVGEHAKQVEGKDPAAASEIAGAGLVAANETRKATPPVDGKKPKARAKKGTIVPNFDTFRKRLVLIIAAVLLLIGFMVWAIFFAPRGHIVVTTRTSDSAVSQQVTLNPSAETSATSGFIKATTKSEKDAISVDFKPSRERNVGERAKGVVSFSSDSISLLRGGVTVSAGTELSSSSGATYTTDETVELTVFNNSGDTGVTATSPGESFNGATGSVNGGPRGINAEITEATSGGTDKTVRVVTQGDIDAAKQKALDEVDREGTLKTLSEQLGDGYVILDDSLQVDTSKLNSNTKVNQEPSGGTATYGGDVTYTLYAVAVTELDDYLKAVIEQQIDDTDVQRVYESGAKETQFTNVDRARGGLSATLSTNGKIGPKVNEDQVKELAAGKRIGDIKSAIEAINGVDSVDVTLSPFWVSTAPKDIEKLSVEFKLDA